MNRKTMMMIKFTAVVALALFAMSTFLQASQGEGVTHKLSSIAEFRECVNFQNHVPLDQVRVIWDVQSAGCLVVLPDGRFLDVPAFIKEIEDFAIAEKFKKGGL